MPYKLFKGRLLDHNVHKAKKPGEGIIFVTNKTPYELNLAVKVPVLCHFYNRIKPGETVYFRTGDITATLEVKQAQQDGSTRYTKTDSVLENVAFALLLCVAGVTLGSIFASLAGTTGCACSTQATVTVTAALPLTGSTATALAPADVATTPATCSCSGIRTGRQPHFELRLDAHGYLQLAQVPHHCQANTQPTHWVGWQPTMSVPPLYHCSQSGNQSAAPQYNYRQSGNQPAAPQYNYSHSGNQPGAPPYNYSQSGNQPAAPQYNYSHSGNQPGAPPYNYSQSCSQPVPPQYNYSQLN